jgi:hypothetical protein
MKMLTPNSIERGVGFKASILVGEKFKKILNFSGN